MMDFQTWQQWLDARNIDIDSMTAELEAALQSQYQADCQRVEPVSEVLVVPMNCSWPARCFWIPATEPAL